MKSDESGYWEYLPTSNDYVGNDSATFRVEIGGQTVDLIYGFKVLNSVGSGAQNPYLYPENCPNGQFWKVSPSGEITPLHLEEEEAGDDLSSIEGVV